MPIKLGPRICLIRAFTSPTWCPSRPTTASPRVRAPPASYCSVMWPSGRLTNGCRCRPLPPPTLAVASIGTCLRSPQPTQPAPPPLSSHLVHSTPCPLLPTVSLPGRVQRRLCRRQGKEALMLGQGLHRARPAGERLSQSHPPLGRRCCFWRVRRLSASQATLGADAPPRPFSPPYFPSIPRSVLTHPWPARARAPSLTRQTRRSSCRWARASRRASRGRRSSITSTSSTTRGRSGRSTCSRCSSSTGEGRLNNKVTSSRRCPTIAMREIYESPGLEGCNHGCVMAMRGVWVCIRAGRAPAVSSPSTRRGRRSRRARVVLARHPRAPRPAATLCGGVRVHTCTAVEDLVYAAALVLMRSHACVASLRLCLLCGSVDCGMREAEP